MTCFLSEHSVIFWDCVAFQPRQPSDSAPPLCVVCMARRTERRRFLEQQLADLRLAIVRGDVQRRAPVSRRLCRVVPRVEQQFCHPKVTSHRRCVPAAWHGCDR